MKPRRYQTQGEVPLFSRLRFQSIFWKTMLSQVVVTLVVGALMLCAMQSVYQQRYREQLSYSGLSVLEAVSGNVDSELASLAAKMTDVFQNPDCNQLIVEGVRKDETLPVQAAQRLSRVARQDSYITQMWLHTPSSGDVISSKHLIEPYQQAKISAVFERYYTMGGDGGRDFTLLSENGSLYLLKSFPEGKRLAAMCIELNGALFWNEIHRNTDSQGGFQIYPYLDRAPAFARYTDYPKEQALRVTEFEQVGERKYFCRSAQEGDYLAVFQSQASKVWYVLAIPDGTPLSGLAGSSRPVLLFFLGTVLILLLSSAFLVRTVYTPVHNLLQSMVSQRKGFREGQWRSASNELDLIRRVHQEETAQEAEMTGLLRQVGSEVSEKLFTSLLEGAELSPEKTQRILRQVDSPYPQEGSYYVFLLYWYYPEGCQFEAVERALHGRAVEVCCRQFWQQLCCAVPDKEERKVLVCHFDAPLTPPQLQRWLKQFGEALARQCGQFRIQTTVGCSQLCPDLYHLAQAKSQAEDDLRKQLYYQQELEEQRAGTQLKQTVNALLNQIAARPNETEDVLSDFLRQYQDQPQFQKAQAVVVDCLTEKLIHMNIPIPPEYLRRKQAWEDAGRSGEESGWIGNFCTEATGWIRAMAGREQFQHIQNAKRYLQAHYEDSTISLDAVSEYCGISSSYLSRMFALYEPPGFLDYLNRYRLEKACQLLTSTQDTVEEVGFQTGFNSPQNFIRVFKRYYNETPGQYRTRRRKEMNQQ